MTDATGKTGILKKMTAVMSEVQYIQKDARNEHGKYRYASEKAIKEAIHPVLAKHGVVFQMNAQAPSSPDGKTQYVPVEYVFWDSETGESISGNFVGSAHTRDEKGYYAAITGAIKYILTSVFLIPTGDDPEDPKNDPKPSKGKSAEPTAVRTAPAGEANPQAPPEVKNPDMFDKLKWIQLAEDVLAIDGMTREDIAKLCISKTGKNVDQVDSAKPFQIKNYTEALKGELSKRQLEVV